MLFLIQGKHAAMQARALQEAAGRTSSLAGLAVDAITAMRDTQ